MDIGKSKWVPEKQEIGRNSALVILSTMAYIELKTTK
jgi:hypothetical protein